MSFRPGDAQLGNAQLGDDGGPWGEDPGGTVGPGEATEPANLGILQLGNAQLGVAGTFATFSLDNQTVSVLGALHVVARGIGTTWSSTSNPFSLANNVASDLRNYEQTSETVAEFDITVDFLAGSDIVVVDANSGTQQRIRTSRATQIYVVDAIAGDDSNTGLASFPWQTVAKVNAFGMMSGDAVQFAASQTFDTDEPLIIVAGVTYSTTARGIFIEQNNPATINYSGTGDGVRAVNIGNLTLDNLIITGPGVDTETGVTDSLGIGLRLESTQPTTKLANILIQACDFTGFQDGCLAYTLTAAQVGYDNLTFKFCRFYANQRNGAYVFNWDGNGFASGVKTQHSNVTFLRCIAHDQPGNEAAGSQGGGIVVSNTTGFSIRFCIVYDLHVAGAASPVGGSTGIAATQSSTGVIADCEVYGVKAPAAVDGTGIDTDASTDNVIVERNFCHHNAGAGFLTGTGTNYSNAGNIWRYNVSFANVSVSTSQAEFYSFGVSPLGGTPTGLETIEITAYGNTFIGTHGRAFALGASSSVTTAKLYNNIFIAPNAKKNIEGFTTAGTKALIGNLYWRPDGTVNVDGITSLAALRAAGYEKIVAVNYGVIGDPLLHNTAGASATGTLPDSDVKTLDWFDLDEGSPAIAQGVLLSDVSISDQGTTDFRGVAVPSGRPNIGAVLRTPLPSLNRLWRFALMFERERRYGVATYVDVPMITKGVTDFALTADWTPATGDVKVSKDGGTAANITTLPTAITMGNTAYWRFALSATEMQAGCTVVTVGDTATKAVEDQFFAVTTYGHPSAFHSKDPISGAQLYATSATGSDSTHTVVTSLSMTTTDAVGTTLMLYTSAGLPVWSVYIDDWDDVTKIALHRAVGTTADSTTFVGHVLSPQATTDPDNLPGVKLQKVLVTTLAGTGTTGDPVRAA